MKREREEEPALNSADFTFESWTKQKGETALAYNAFCAFRDYGPERNIIKALHGVEKDVHEAKRKYRSWRNWAYINCWKKRAGDYDKYLDSIHLTEERKLVEKRREAHRQTMEKVLTVVNKKLDTMAPEDLAQNNLIGWAKTAIETERAVLGISAEEGADKNGQPVIRFDHDFEGL